MTTAEVVLSKFYPSVQSDLAGKTVMCRIGEVASMGSSGKLLTSHSFHSLSGLGNKPICLLLFFCNVIVAFAFE